MGYGYKSAAKEREAYVTVFILIPSARSRTLPGAPSLEAGRGAQCNVDRADVDPLRAEPDTGRVGMDVSHIQIDGPAKPLRFSSALTPAQHHVDSGLRDESPVAVGLEP